MIWIWCAEQDTGDIDDGVFLVHSRHDLRLFGDVHRRLHTRQRREHLLGQRTLVTDRADHGALDAARMLAFKPAVSVC
jgi:hypothetical protein